MLSKLTYKIVLEYYLDNKKVIFSSKISSDGLATTTIAIGDNKVIETTINGRVLSGEVTLNGVTSGYEYVYDKDGITIALNPKNKNISVTESVSLINKLKNSKDFFKVRTDGVLASNNSSDFISIPDQNFIVYKEVSLIDTSNTYIYFTQQNFTCLEKSTEIKNEEETYQINDNYVSLITDFKENKKNMYCNIDEVEIENIKEDEAGFEKTQSLIHKIAPLKAILLSTPKNYKDLKIEVMENTKKTIRRAI